MQTDFFDPARYPLPRYPFDVPAHTVHSVPSSQKTFERGLEDLLVYVPELVQSLRNLTTELHGVIDNANVAGTTRSMREALEELRKAIAAIDWDGIEERARSTLDSATATGAELRAMVAELRAPEGGLQRALGGATSLVEELRSSLRSADLPAVAKSLRRLTDELAPLGDEATEALATLRRAADAIRELAALLRTRSRRAAARPRRRPRPAHPPMNRRPLALALLLLTGACLSRRPRPHCAGSRRRCRRSRQPGSPRRCRFARILVSAEAQLGDRMLLRTSDVEFFQDDLARWIAMPAAFAEQALHDVLLGGGYCRDAAEGAELRVVLREFEGSVGERNAALVAFDVALAGPSGVRRATLRRSIAVEGGDAASLARGLGAALAATAVATGEWLDEPAR